MRIWFSHKHVRIVAFWKTCHMHFFLFENMMCTWSDHTNANFAQWFFSGGDLADGRSDGAPILKPTTFINNSIQMLRRLHRVCRCGHVHQPLLAGRAAFAAFYQVPLLTVIFKWMNGTTHMQGPFEMTKGEYAVFLLWMLRFSKLRSMFPCRPVSLPRKFDPHAPFNITCNILKRLYKHEYTNDDLQRDFVCAAIKNRLF